MKKQILFLSVLFSLAAYNTSFAQFHLGAKAGQILQKLTLKVMIIVLSLVFR